MTFPTDGVILSHILVIDDVQRTKDWYQNVLGAKLYGEYGGTTVIFDLNGAWLVLVMGGGPTADKPDVIMATLDNVSTVSHSMTLRVKDCRAAYAELKERGANFLTAPVETEWEIRAFFRDPDGHLFEISESKA
jgi:catechol 2,3-dioxygenase-like lactoylglutathione lyase family enzyme